MSEIISLPLQQYDSICTLFLYSAARLISENETSDYVTFLAKINSKESRIILAGRGLGGPQITEREERGREDNGARI